MLDGICPRSSPTPTGGYFAHRRRGESPCGECTRRFVEHNARYRAGRGRDYRIYEVDCDHCGERAQVTKKNARFCSHECADASRVIVPSTELDVWRPPVCRGPGPRWMPRRAPKHPPIHGTLFVYGKCAWCSDPFMALAADWAHRSLYCSKSCAGNAGRARRGRFTIPPGDRRAIHERDGWICQLCGDPVDPTLGTSDVWGATLDHIVPQSHVLVPDHSPSNLRLAHRWCNSVRGDERYYTAADLRVA